MCVNVVYFNVEKEISKLFNGIVSGYVYNSQWGVEPALSGHPLCSDDECMLHHTYCFHTAIK